MNRMMITAITVKATRDHLMPRLLARRGGRLAPRDGCAAGELRSFISLTL